MRPKISWSDLAGARVGIWGLGVEGSANLRRLKELGVDDPVLVDDHPPAVGPDGRPVLATGTAGLPALLTCEVVVKTPGISRYRPEVAALTERGVAVVGGLGLWMQEAPIERVAAITGTKGKSTTTALAGHLATGLGHRCLVAGNIGRPPWDPSASAAGPYDYYLVETSSYQATDLAASPPVVAVTSLHPDHLDWHGDTETYYRDKLSACTQPGADLTVADGDSPDLRANARLLGPRVRWVHDDDPSLGGPWTEPLGLLGAHNRRNALVARACLLGLGVPGADDPAALAEAALGFGGLESRLRTIGSVGEVRFVDDSLATNVLPTVAALGAMGDARVALLVGGYDRGIDYAPLGEAVRLRAAPTLVVTLPDNGPRIGRAVLEAGVRTDEVLDCPDVTTAVVAGFAWAAPDGVVLLSPAAPSFGRYHSYRERAADFAAAMATCRRAPVSPAGGAAPPD
jgi:UDP-N-acetylmuramoylalanine--D-glutamate ligase